LNMSVNDPKSEAAIGERSSVARGVLATLWTMKYRHHIVQERLVQAATYEGACRVAEKFLQGIRGSRLIEIRPFVQLSEAWLEEAIAAEKEETRRAQKELGVTAPPVSEPEVEDGEEDEGDPALPSPQPPQPAQPKPAPAPIAPPANAIPLRDKDKDNNKK